MYTYVYTCVYACMYAGMYACRVKYVCIIYTYTYIHTDTHLQANYSTTFFCRPQMEPPRPSEDPRKGFGSGALRARLRFCWWFGLLAFLGFRV